MLTNVHICNKTDERIHCDVVYVSLKVLFYIIALKAIDLSLIEDQTYLGGKRSGCGPEILCFWTVDGSTEHQNRWEVKYSAFVLNRLISSTSSAPATGIALAF